MKKLKSNEPKRITTPLTDDEVIGLRTGDRVLITGELITARDAAHKRLYALIQQGKPLPFDPKGQIIYYFGPSPTPPGAIIGSGGPTTAERMDAFTPALLELGIKGMIGKGGRSAEIREALKKYKSVYFITTSVASVLLSKRIVATENICWEDLGAEAVRKLKVEDFPAIVANDTYGTDIYEMAREKFKQKS